MVEVTKVRIMVSVWKLQKCGFVEGFLETYFVPIIIFPIILSLLLLTLAITIDYIIYAITRYYSRRFSRRLQHCSTTVLLTGYVYKTSAFDLQCPSCPLSLIQVTRSSLHLYQLQSTQVDLLLSHGKLLYYHYPY